MALSNAQYEELKRTYDQTQLKNQRIREKRLQEAYKKIPRLQEIEAEIASSSVSKARLLLDGDLSALNDLKSSLASLREEKARLIANSGYPSDYFDPIYDCADCKDTGYLSDGQTRCHCFKQAIINTIYSQSNIQSIIQTENFDAFSLDYYSPTDFNKATQKSSRETAKYAYERCRYFVDNFDSKPRNLFLYGNTGVGKTFLSNCIAKEILDKGYSVIYFTAFELFDIFSHGVFDKDEEAIAAHRNIFDCDLLIIDDLGTENSNSFTSSQLFLCVSERILRQKSTIISTNLNLGQIRDVFSERTSSRITSNYDIVVLYGDDIRIQKRQKRFR